MIHYLLRFLFQLKSEPFCFSLCFSQPVRLGCFSFLHQRTLTLLLLFLLPPGSFVLLKFTDQFEGCVGVHLGRLNVAPSIVQFHNIFIHLFDLAKRV